MTLAEEVAAGSGLTLVAAAKLLPGRGGRRVSPVTLMRWVYRGAKGVDGRRVKLEAARVGSSWMTTRPAVVRFVAALNGPRTEQTPRTAARHAGAELEKLGL